jgi:F0F1-type ATP synthase assembly protein I
LKTMEWMIRTENKTKFDEAAVGALALISMYQTATFLILQFLLFIPIIIADLLMESYGWEKSAKELVVLILLIVLELILVFVLANKGKLRFEQYKQARFNYMEDHPQKQMERFTPVISESKLEIALIIATIIGIVWGFLLGLQVKALPIVLIVIEGFGFLFLFIFILIRYMTTQVIRPTAIACLILEGLSLWGLLYKII